MGERAVGLSMVPSEVFQQLFGGCTATSVLCSRYLARRVAV